MTTSAAPTAAAKAPSQQEARSGGLRKDIQGLRAVAVTLVVIYHLWPDTLSGGYVGVDVFLVVSGYLITSHLLKKPPRTGRDLGKFWGRRIRRLLPAAFTVLATTTIALRLLAPSTMWAEMSQQIIAATLYVQNWALALSSVSYMDGSGTSPVQHFWSLSVEEQFYLAWPLLVLGVAWFVAKRSGRTSEGSADLATVRLTRTMILLVVLLSLAASVLVTAYEPAAAYFITPVRMWELALGGLVATFAAPGPRTADGPIGVGLAWIGLAAILAAAWWYTSATHFPGYAALLPVGGAALLVLVGSNSVLSPTGLLRGRPVQWLGDVSYSVYLWHWPMIALLPFVSHGSLGIIDKSAIIAATLVLAWLTKVHVEDRFRSPGPGTPLRRSYQIAGVGMVLVVLLAAMQWSEAELRKESAKKELASVEEASTPCLGAATLVKDDCAQEDAGGKVVPEPELATQDKADIDEKKCFPEGRYDQRLSCSYGSGDTRIALVGNSHARHWLPALRKLAKKRDWTIDTYIISTCTATDATQSFDTGKKSKDCHAWGQWAQEQTKGDKYDLVITSERQSAPIEGHSLKDSGPAATTGYESYLQRWADAGTNVLAIKDPAFPGMDVPKCVAEHPDDHDACSGSRKDWRIQQDPLIEAAKKVDDENIATVNYDDLVCDTNRCRGVNGGVLTYYDASHLTATYAKTMAPYMAKPIEKALRS